MRAVRSGLRAGVLGVRAMLVVAVGYLTVLTVAAWSALRRRPADQSSPAPRHRFLVLVPAHDEERVIGLAMRSLTAMNYPNDLYEVHVVADNCTDATADIVRTSGVEVHERDDPGAPGKGPALQWLMARLDARCVQYDAVAFLDADTTAHPGFLRRVDAEMTRGALVVQGHYAVRDPGSSPVVAFRAASLAARNFLRPLGRTQIGGTAGLYGNGMAFRAGVIRAREWSDHLTEDAELQLELLVDGVKVAFAPTALVEAEMPATMEGARTQHERWERGRLDLARRFVPELLRRSLVGGPAGRVAYLDAALDQAVPPFSIVVAGSMAWTTIAFGRHVVRPTARSRRSLVRSVLVLLAQLGYVLSALRMVGAPASVYRSLARAPQMVAWKLVLWVRVLVNPRRATWTRTARNEPK